MKIHSLAAQNFLSFASLHLPLQAGSTIITGPNGAGKSNLGSAIALPRLLLEQGLRGSHNGVDPLEVFEQAGHNGADAFTVSLEMELDQSWEQELVRLFVEAVFSGTTIDGMTSDGPHERNAWELVAGLSVPMDSIQSILRGTLQVAFAARRRPQWWAAWNFHHRSSPFQLVLIGPGAGRLRHGHFPPGQIDLMGASEALRRSWYQSMNRSGNQSTSHSSFDGRIHWRRAFLSHMQLISKIS